MYCKECGNKILQDAFFCTSCGAKLPVSDVTITLPDSINYEEKNVPELDSQPTSSRLVDEAPSYSKKNNRTKWIALSLGFIIIVSGLIYYFHKKHLVHKK